MPINSKAKGKRFELRLAGILRDYGFQDCRRTAQYCGNTGDASDIVGLPGIHIEAQIGSPYIGLMLRRFWGGM